MVCLSTRMNGCVYVDRKSKSSTVNAFDQCVDGVNRGFSIVVFPEATWNLTESLSILPRYWGDVKMAKETGRPIVPAILEYTSKVCVVKFGKCIWVSEQDSIVEKDREVFDAMVQLKTEIRSSDDYIKHYEQKEYTQWLKRNIKNYKYFDVSYEMSCIRDEGNIPPDELNEILRIGEEIRPLKAIKEELRYAKINYRYNENT